MGLWQRILRMWRGRSLPEPLRLGQLGEAAARRHLRRAGLKLLATNFRTPRGEIDLILREGQCLVFAEVKTRSSEAWVRPAAAVDERKRRALTRTALDYLRLLEQAPVKVRFDVVEVLLEDGTVREVRHLPNAFPMPRPFRYG